MRIVTLDFINSLSQIVFLQIWENKMSTSLQYRSVHYFVVNQVSNLQMIGPN